jgi:hypothetical protein
MSESENAVSFVRTSCRCEFVLDLGRVLPEGEGALSVGWFGRMRLGSIRRENNHERIVGRI